MRRQQKQRQSHDAHDNRGEISSKMYNYIVAAVSKMLLPLNLSK
jgi:hypothetical protein